MPKKTKKLWPVVLLLVLVLAVGTLAFSHIEQWSAIDSFYFTATTLMTIGYGDFVPTHGVSKIFTVLFALSGVAIFLYGLGIIASFYFEKSRQFEDHEARKIKELVSNMKGPFNKSRRSKQ